MDSVAVLPAAVDAGAAVDAVAGFLDATAACHGSRWVARYPGLRGRMMTGVVSARGSPSAGN